MQQPQRITATAVSLLEFNTKLTEYFKSLRAAQSKLLACLDKSLFTLSNVPTQALLNMHQEFTTEQQQETRRSSSSVHHTKKTSISNWFHSNVINKLGLQPYSAEERFRLALNQYVDQLQKFPLFIDDALKLPHAIEWEVVYLLKLVSSLCSDYRRYTFLVMPLVRGVVSRCNDYLMFIAVSRRCHSIGFQYDLIPFVTTIKTIAKGSMQTNGNVPPFVKRIRRHPIDARYDTKTLHDIKAINLKDGLDISEQEVKSEAQILMEFFCQFKDDQQYCTDGDSDNESDVACKLTATYPMIKPSRLFPDNSQHGEDEEILLNDPNADAFLFVECEDFFVGCVADGMGAGHHARIASNLLCAVMLARVCGYSYNNKEPLLKLDFSSTGDILRFLDETIRDAQRVMCTTEECGGTTLIMWVLAKVYKPSDDYTHILNYVIAGDAEGYHYTSSVPQDYQITPQSPSSLSQSHSASLGASSDGKMLKQKHKNLSKKWRSLHQFPTDSEGIRLSTSVTPGGIGRHHGSEQLIWGAFTHPQYVKMNLEALRSGMVGSKDTVVGQLPSLSDFYAYPNNIHFGQTFCEADDYVIFASDGLGDTLDPLQLYPRPYLIHGLEGFSSWHSFQKEFDNSVNGYGSAMVSRDLKEMAINNVLGPVMTPYGIDGSSSVDLNDSTNSLKMAFNPTMTFTPASPENSPTKSKHVSHHTTAEMIMEACVKHAMDATKGDRELYYDDKFLKSSRAEKTKVMEQLIDKFLNEKLPFRRYVSLPPNSTATSRTQQQLSVRTAKSGKVVGMTGAVGFVRFGLPSVFSPYAKVDHLGIEVLRIGSL